MRTGTTKTFVSLSVLMPFRWCLFVVDDPKASLKKSDLLVTYREPPRYFKIAKWEKIRNLGLMDARYGHEEFIGKLTKKRLI